MQLTIWQSHHINNNAISLNQPYRTTAFTSCGAKFLPNPNVVQKLQIGQETENGKTKQTSVVQLYMLAFAFKKQKNVAIKGKWKTKWIDLDVLIIDKGNRVLSSPLFNTT